MVVSGHRLFSRTIYSLVYVLCQHNTWFALCSLHVLCTEENSRDGFRRARLRTRRRSNTFVLVPTRNWSSFCLSISLWSPENKSVVTLQRFVRIFSLPLRVRFSIHDICVDTTGVQSLPHSQNIAVFPLSVLLCSGVTVLSSFLLCTYAPVTFLHHGHIFLV